MHRVAQIALPVVLALALSCGKIDQSSGPAATSPTPTPPAAQASPAHVALSFVRVGGRKDAVHGVSLDVTRVLAFTGDTPARPADGAACTSAGARSDPAAVQVALDLTSPGRTALGRVDVAQGVVGELRLLVRAADVEEGGRHRRGHGRLTCVDDDGSVLIVVRLLPAEHLELAGDDDFVALFDDQNHVAEEACEVDDHGGDEEGDCEVDDDGQHAVAADHGGGSSGGGGGGGGGGADHPPGHDQDGGTGGGGGDGAHGSRIMIADELPLARSR